VTLRFGGAIRLELAHQVNLQQAITSEVLEGSAQKEGLLRCEVN